MANTIEIRLGLKGASEVTAGLRQVQASVTSAFGALKALAVPLAGAAGFAGITAGLKDIVDLGGKLKDMAAATGVGAAKLMVYSTALKDAGVNADNMGAIFGKMSKSLEDAFDGSGPGAKGLATIGLDINDLINRDPATQFESIAAAIAKLASPSERSAAAMAIFGKGANELVPFFRDGGALTDAAKTLGMLPEVMQRNAKTLDAIGDSFGHLKIKGQQLFAGFLDLTAPLIQSFTDLIDGIDLTAIGRKFGAAVLLIKKAWNDGKLDELIGLTIEAGFELGRLGFDKTMRGLIDLLSSADFWKPVGNAFLTAMNQAAATFFGALAMTKGQEEMIRKFFSNSTTAGRSLMGVDQSSAGTPAADELGRRINAIAAEHNRLAGDGVQKEHLMTIAVRERVDWLGKERFLSGEIAATNQQIRDLESNFGMTDAEKFGRKQDLLRSEIALQQDKLDLLRAQAAIEADPGKQQALMGRADAAQNAIMGTQGQLSSMGANPNSFSDQWKKAFADVRNEWGTVAQNIANVGKTAMQGLTRTMGNALDDMIWRTGSLKDLWKSFAHTLTSSVTQALSNMFAQWIAGIIAKKGVEVAAGTAETAAKTPGALMDSISSFGIAAGVGAAALLAAMAAFGGFREHGGPVSAGSAYVVGEKRPELFIPSTSGVILPRVDMGKPVSVGASSSTGATPEVHVHFVTDPVEAMKAAAKDPSVQHVIVDGLRRRRLDIGIQS